MDIIALLKAERDKAAQQVNALDTAIRALRGLSSTRVSHGPNERRCTSKNFGVSKSTLGTSAGPEGCLHRSQAAHLSGRSSADQNSKSGEMGEGESAEEITASISRSVRGFSFELIDLIFEKRDDHKRRSGINDFLIPSQYRCHEFRIKV